MSRAYNRDRRRVVVTGMGAVTPLGHSVEELFGNLLEGKSGIGPITTFDARSFPTTFAAEVKDFDLGKWLPDADRYTKCGVNTRFALAAAHQALADSGLKGGDRTRYGCYIGSGEGGEDFTSVITGCGAGADERGFKVSPPKFTAVATRLLDPGHEREVEMHTSGGHVADYFDLCGPNLTCLTACAASAQALGEASAIIRRGDADVMVSGGSHSMIHGFGVTGFNRLTALSTRRDAPQKASRPFDLDRDGFVLGEGSGMLVLEELDHAKARKATIYAELSGYGTTGDAYRMTDPHPEGRGAVRCMQEALKEAGLTAEDVGYVNAHGTSTHANDSSETAGIKAAFGAHAYKCPVSSSKSMIGHLIAAGGAVELIICIMALRRGVLPPTINYETPDPDCDLDYVPNAARPVTGLKHALSNSFGFGGQNTALIASKF